MPAPSNKRHTRRNIVIGTIAIALAAGVAYWVMSHNPKVLDSDDPTLVSDGSGDVQIGTVPYQLMDMNSQPLTQASFPGKYKLVFFGYSSCPDECPLALHTMADALKKLGPDAAKIQVIFISVDPKRDTADVLKKYLAGFDARIIGATGTEAQIKVAEDSFRAYASDGNDGPDAAEHHDADANPKPDGGEDGDIQHSDNIYLLSPQNGLLNVFSGDVDAASLTSEIQTDMAAALLPADGAVNGDVPASDVAPPEADVPPPTASPAPQKK